MTNERERRGAGRVSDLANLETQSQKGRNGYNEIVTDGTVKRGQHTMTEDNATFRLLMRAEPGTAEKVAFARADMNSRKKVKLHVL